MRRHTREGLAADDAVQYEITLHREDIQRARDDRAVVPGAQQEGGSVCSRCESANKRAYPQEYRACTIERMPVLGPKTALILGMLATNRIF